MNFHQTTGLSRRAFLRFGGSAAGVTALSGLAGLMATKAAHAVEGTATTDMTDQYLPSSPIYGTFDERFREVRDAFAWNLDTSQDIGASVAMFIDGQPVVDLWGGYWDDSYTRHWERDTIANCFSSTKTITAICALVLSDMGELDLKARVSKYWPEFAAEGKGDIEVRELLGYSSGMAGWTEPVTLNDLYDWEKSTALLAAQAPWWKPGTAVGYHAFTIGHLVGEVVRRITGETMGTFLQKELAGPLRADFFIGTGPELDERVSMLTPGYPIIPHGDKFYERALLNPPATPYDSRSIGWRRAEMGALNGHGNGYGIAAIQSVLANGGAFGKRMMSEAGRERVLEQTGGGVDVVLGLPITWGQGYSLDAAYVPNAVGRRVAFWPGGGGSMSWVDLDYRMSFGYVPNRWLTGPHEQTRSRSILQAVYRCLAA